MAEPVLPEPLLLGVLVTYRRPDALRASLGALARQIRRLDHLVVVDNGPDRVASAVVDETDAAARVDYLPAGDNLGPAGGIELGMRHLLADAPDTGWICVLDDDDPLPDDRVVAELAAEVARASALDRSIGGVGLDGAVFDWPRARLLPVELGADGRGHADYLKSNWCPFYRVDAVRSTGPFDGRLFFGFDDLEFCLRLRAAGRTLLVAPGTRRRPDVAPPPRRRLAPVDWRRYYSLRNLIVILRRHRRRTAAARLSLVVVLGKPLLNVVLTPRLAARHLALGGRALRDGWSDRLGRRVEPDGGPRRTPISRASDP
jgi:GT2 family glycosyltransferase